jgi:hypothetical protein
MAKAKKKGKGKKKGKKQTIDLTLRMNVKLQQGKQQPRKERVKRITSRKRQNLREMRRGMLTQAQAAGGGGGQSVFANPAFYGNVKMLTDSAMNQFQNQRYSLEQQVRESSAEQKAMLAAGRADAAQQAAQALVAQTRQLADLQQRFGFQSQQLAAAAGVEKGKAVTLQQQQEQQAIEQQYAAETQAEQEAQRKARLAEVRAYSDERLREEASQLPGLKALDFSPQAFSAAKFKQTKDDIVKVLALGDPDDTAALVDQFKATHRAQGRTESREKKVQALRLQAKKEEGTPKKAARGYGSDEEEEQEEEEDVVYGSADEYESE